VRVARSIAAVREALASHRDGTVIGLVPTMGALHAGHASLLAAARTECDLVVASVFVNPAQFDDPADLDRYPRDVEEDELVASAEGVDVLFVPDVTEMYPPGFQTWVEVEELSGSLEGEFRPGSLRGVATVCLKLFTIVRPRRAYFGQKDAQQAAVVRRLVRDLELELEIRVLPTVRDLDGLAVSSRNAHLDAGARERALALPRALEAGLAAYRAGSDPVAAARAELTDLETDYVAVADFDGPVLAVAARVGDVRLIDNVPLEGEPA
jgi:pantoate--beta-alanine ligase